MKRLLLTLLIVLSILQLVSAEQVSKTQYDLIMERIEAKGLHPRLVWIDVTNNFTFMGNEDYEIYIESMQNVLKDTPIIEDTPWYFSTPALMSFSFIAGAALL